MGRLLTLCTALLLATSVQAKTYALVIGIDDYDHIPDLQGAVNDARDIADALTGLGADVTLMLDGEVTRDAVIANWRAIAAEVGEGDQFVISYAGHGSNEPAAYPGNEADGLDENFLLAGFSPYGTDAGERLRDDEIADLLSLTPGAQVIFVADACHSGTVSRNLVPVLGYRYVQNGVMRNDPLPPPPPRTPVNDARDEVALFLAAVPEAEKVPEFLIDGQARGALSYAFAKALRGAADADGDSNITKDEIATYVRRTVRQISQGVQAPQVSPAGQGGDRLFQTRGAVIPTQPADVFSLSFSGLPVLTLRHDGDARTDRMFAQIEGVRVVPPEAAATLTFETATGDLRSMVGDVVRALGPTEAATFKDNLQTAIDKMRIANALASAAGGTPLEVRFAEGDRSYTTGDLVTARVTGRVTPHIALFAVSSNGSMANLYPIQDAALGLDDPLTLPPSETLDLQFQVTPPYGADHLIAFETPNDSPELRAALAAAEKTGDLRGFWDLLRGATVYMSAPPTVTVFPFYTTRP